MTQPQITLRQLLEAGVHFGHQKPNRNPLMQPYVHSTRNGIDILDLTQTAGMLETALSAITDTLSKGGRLLYVGTKRQAQKTIADSAEAAAQHYINQRWMGGILTNWKTVSNSLGRLKAVEEQLAQGTSGLTKKERLGLEKQQRKLLASLGGVREMGGVPDIIFIIDVNKEAIAVAEARKLGITVVAVVDSNASPIGIDHMIPGNDDAARAIELYCDLVTKAAVEGMRRHLEKSGVDIGANAEGLVQELPEPDPDPELPEPKPEPNQHNDPTPNTPAGDDDTNTNTPTETISDTLETTPKTTPANTKS